MHRFASRRTLWRLKFSSLCFLACGATWIALPAALVWGMFFHDPRGIRLTIILLGSAFGVGLLYLMTSGNLRCPLCRGQLLRKLAATPVSPKASRAFGSVRAAIALRALFTRWFRCFHCGEPCNTREPRQRGH
ncbi:hypothetical protein HAHE_36720 [Haloferula helveola]|uniref:Integron gene cassette protein n=1 Tax=Haloferula helveola TaxID=490095 RepID=A0ABM7RQX2_9BACT|nr:hypothetical protein HAHE_36720 [Haloferula helveola]